MNSSALGFLYVTAHAFLSAAAVCEAGAGPVGVLVDVVGSWLPEIMPATFGEYARMIEARTYDGDGLKLANAPGNLCAILDYGTNAEVNTDLFAGAHRSFESASSSGFGPNLAAVFETLRPAE